VKVSKLIVPPAYSISWLANMPDWKYKEQSYVENIIILNSVFAKEDYTPALKMK
jgi:hypothetical protein